MAVAFLLAVTFHDPQAAARSMAAGATESITVRGVRLPLAVHPQVPGVGEHTLRPAGPVAPGGLVSAHSLTAAEATSVADQLYDVLRRMDGYRAAAVGWDPECDVDLAELEDHVADGTIDTRIGVVLADDLATRWGLGPDWVPFAEGYRWIPWRDWRPSSVPARDDDQ